VREYEAYYIFSPRVTEEKREALIARLEKKIKDSGSTELTTEKQGLKKLAFRFNKYPDLKDGYFVLTRFTAEPAVVTGVTEVLRLTEDVIRFQVTHAVPAAQAVEAKEEKVEISAAMLEGGNASGQS
jgi:small subunit ribosomal protein S6